MGSYDKCSIDKLAFIEKDELEKMLEKLGTSFDKTINLFDSFFYFLSFFYINL